MSMPIVNRSSSFESLYSIESTYTKCLRDKCADHIRDVEMEKQMRIYKKRLFKKTERKPFLERAIEEIVIEEGGIENIPSEIRCYNSSGPGLWSYYDTGHFAGRDEFHMQIIYSTFENDFGCVSDNSSFMGDLFAERNTFYRRRILSGKERKFDWAFPSRKEYEITKELFRELVNFLGVNFVEVSI